MRSGARRKKRAGCKASCRLSCAWTKRINIEGRWVALDEFLTSKLTAKSPTVFLLKPCRKCSIRWRRREFRWLVKVPAVAPWFGSGLFFGRFSLALPQFCR